VLGPSYIGHYDAEGLETGTSETKSRFLGPDYVQHHDADGRKSGHSEEKDRLLGSGTYMQHYDDAGRKAGYSEKKTDFWGREYWQHYDQGGRKRQEPSGNEEAPPCGETASALDEYAEDEEPRNEYGDDYDDDYDDDDAEDEDDVVEAVSEDHLPTEAGEDEKPGNQDRSKRAERNEPPEGAGGRGVTSPGT
jgi:hypothetical protein